MPELPEVETMVRGIRSAVEGKRIVEFRRAPCPCRAIPLRPGLAAIKRRCEGQKVAAVRRRAKKIVLELSGGEAFVIEPRMTGLMLVADPPDNEHLRFEWRLAKNRRRQCGLNDLFTIPAAQSPLLADWQAFCGGTR